MKKYILLDLDGVMIKLSHWKPLSILDDGFPEFDKISVSNLNKILNETKADIVLTSSHKNNYNLSQWCQIFLNRGISSTITKIEINDSRINEVMYWVRENLDRNFIILDDDKSLNDLSQNIKDRLILITPLVGINEEIVELSIKKLNSL